MKSFFQITTFLFVSILTNAQNKLDYAPFPDKVINIDEYVNDSHKDNSNLFYDGMGNFYADLTINKSRISGSKSADDIDINPDFISSSGLFHLYYVAENLTNNEYAIVEQVINDFDALIIPNNSPCDGGFDPVHISVGDMLLPTALGSATPCYEFHGEDSGIQYNLVWKAINTGVNDPNQYDGGIKINPSINWYYGLDGQPGSQEYDLYSVVLHEFTHTLGFFSLMNENAQNIGFNNNLFSSYDACLIRDNLTTILLENNIFDWTYNGDNPSQELFNSCLDDMDLFGPDILLEMNNGVQLPIYTGSVFEAGSSFSHLGLNCDNSATEDFLMIPSYSVGISTRITNSELNVLNQIGYNTSNQFGADLTNTGLTNPNIAIFTPFNVEMPYATNDLNFCCDETPFEMSQCDNSYIFDEANLLCNDIIQNPNVSIAHFEEISSGIALTDMDGSWSYSPSTTGDVYLRYVLQNETTGIYSNYAYVKIFVTPCPSVSCPDESTEGYTDDNCNLICNPEIVDYNGDCYALCEADFQNQIECIEGWSTLFATPDFFDANCSEAIGQPDGQGGVLKMITLGTSLFQNTDEGVFTMVDLQQGVRYNLSFWLRADQTLSASGPVEVGMFNYESITWDTYGLNGDEVFGNESIITVNASQIISNGWRQFVVCVTPQQNWNSLYFRVLGPGSSGTFLDFVELVEIPESELATVVADCGEEVVLGSTVCGVENMTYAWFDVTNNVQLTDGNQTLDDDITIVDGSNGAQISFNATQGGTYELVVDHNAQTYTCSDTFVQELEISNSISFEKSIVNGNNFYAEETVDYQIDICNCSALTIEDVSIVDDFPEEFLDVSTFETNVEPDFFDVLTSEINFNDLTVPAFECVTINYSMSIFPAVEDGLFVTNTATVFYDDSSITDQASFEIPCQCPCFADINCDNFINGSDLVLFLGAFGLNTAECENADINGDGEVNGGDLVLLLGNFGGQCQGNGSSELFEPKPSNDVND